ncbi:PTS sugar transporter subunit IIA [Ideonella livida]|uniref:PTS fructose transporter subunit IIA n=1 Tax=Ideonella livida TaxID=2707176 RepID=A0A7C9TK98_9BURK|nr:PTS fructose transporter subunit IIA [Ideonella livida]NDY92659.1 PTS fructose transporter subunit IIA [Ideonella livida]
MPGFLIVAHAPLATAMKATAMHAFPDAAGQVQALDVEPHWSPDEVELRARGLLSLGDTLILTDVFGATPCNGAQRLCEGPSVRLVAGLNVPMLWRVLCYAGEPLDALVGRAVAGGTQGVLQAASQRPQNQPIHSARHDQDHARHQQ